MELVRPGRFVSARAEVSVKERIAPNAEFEEMLTGGHPNSLGRTVEVVDLVLADASRLADLYSCYFSQDEIVRLRVSNAMKRVAREEPEWVVPYIDALIDDVARIRQASTQWTLATLFRMLWARMTAAQQRRAKRLLTSNLEDWHDWIVLNTTMEALTEWASDDAALRTWLRPRLEALAGDPRRSVAGRASTHLKRLERL
jgi:hypothetical protein